ncbi:MAG: thiamine-phosphate kinase [Candidatus Aminicenantales bacterium]
MKETVADIGEFGLIRRIRHLLGESGVREPALSVDIGDDTAAYMPRKGYELLITCDSLVEGRHFLADRISPFALGKRSMVANISDIGAMGGLPRFALVSLGLQPDMLVSSVEQMYRGFLEELSPFGGRIIGGNITRSDGRMFIDITLLGEAERDKILCRSGAKPGDSILVTGYPGEAAAGLRILLNASPAEDLGGHPLVAAYRTPSHRAHEGHAVARSGLAHAMIDTSDGFLGDLGHICEESRVGAEVFEERLPLSPDIKEAAKDYRWNPLDLFLGDSDDYELIITCGPEHVPPLCSVIQEVSPVLISEVGRITDEPGVIQLVSAGGKKRRVGPSGWDHFSR